VEKSALTNEIFELPAAKKVNIFEDMDPVKFDEEKGNCRPL